MRVLINSLVFILSTMIVVSAQDIEENNNKKTLVPFDFTVEKGVNGSCEFDNVIFPEKFLTYAAGGYSGRKINYQIDESGYQATQFDVAVYSPNDPVSLILVAYEPSIWNIGWSKGTDILAIYVMGSHKQVVAGIGNDIPLIISGGENSTCDSFYVDREDLTRLTPLSNKLFNRDVNKVYFAREGKILIGDKVPLDMEFITDPNDSPSKYYLKENLGGEPALIEAVNLGLIRAANQQDFLDWEEVVNKSAGIIPTVTDKGEVATIASNIPIRFHLADSYVVLKEFTLPNGLKGANSVNFFVPKGIPYPKGDLGHSAIYDFNSVSCQGARCASKD